MIRPSPGGRTLGATAPVLRWVAPLETRISRPRSRFPDRILAAASPIGRWESAFVSIDPHRGALQWRHELGEGDPGTPAALPDGTLVLPVRTGRGFRTGVPEIHLVDREGRLLEKRPVAALRSNSPDPPHAAAGRDWIVLGVESYVQCSTGRDLAPAWTCAETMVALAGDRLVTRDGWQTLVGRALPDPTPIWRTSLGLHPNVNVLLGLDDDLLIAPVYADGGRTAIAALSTATGRLVWRQTIDYQRALLGPVVLALARDELVRLAREDGREISRSASPAGAALLAADHTRVLLAVPDEPQAMLGTGWTLRCEMVSDPGAVAWTFRVPKEERFFLGTADVDASDGWIWYGSSRELRALSSESV